MIYAPRKFARATAAVAAVEFALISTTLMLMFIATFQVLLLLRTSEKLNTMTGNVASMVAVQNPGSGNLLPATLADICQGAAEGLSPLPPRGLTIAIASVTVTTVGAKVDYWESDYSFNGGCTPAPTQNTIGATAACNDAIPLLPVGNGAVDDNAIIVRATLTYPGLVGLWLPSSPTLTQTAFTRWAFAAKGNELTLNNAKTSEACAA